MSVPIGSIMKVGRAAASLFKTAQANDNTTQGADNGRSGLIAPAMNFVRLVAGQQVASRSDRLKAMYNNSNAVPDSAVQ